MEKYLVLGILFIAAAISGACSECRYQTEDANAGQFIRFTDCSTSQDREICYQAPITSPVSKQARGPIIVNGTPCSGGGGGTVGLYCAPAWYGGHCYTIDELLEEASV